MLIYVTLSLGRYPRRFGSPSLFIGLFGIFLVMVSVLIGYAAVSYLQVKSSLISLEVIPFLILAIGVDNMFIICQAIAREHSNSIDKRVALAIQDVAPSIMVACVTEIITFAVGIATNIPALKVFCMTAVFAILGNFLLQMTAFISIVAWDMKRPIADPSAALQRHDKGRDPLPAEKLAANAAPKGCFAIATSFIMNKTVNVVVFLLSLTMVIGAVITFPKIQLGLDQQITVRTDGILYNVPLKIS